MNSNYRKTGLILPCLAIIAVRLAAGSAYAGDNNDNPGQFLAAEYKFAKAAACGGTMEVNLGKIASEKSANASVQEFGRRMVTEHTKAGDELQQIASRKGATLPSEPTVGQQKEIDRLTKLSGSEFDTAYITLMVKDHKADAKEFKRASETIKDVDLKTFATSTLTMVQSHLALAQDLEDKLKRNVSMNQ